LATSVPMFEVRMDVASPHIPAVFAAPQNGKCT